MLDLVEYAVANGIANVGCPDGGGWVPRGGNPLVTNPFFNIFDLRILRKQFSKQAVRQFSYAEHKEEMISTFPKDLLYKERNYNFDRIDYEPYYPFFIWQACNTATLYLHSARHSDGWTTLLFDPQGREICRHTWLARFYSVPSFVVKHWQPSAGKQQQRIDNIIRESYTIRHLQLPVFMFQDKVAFLANMLARWIIKVPQRIANWPNKLQKQLKKRHQNCS